MKSLSKKLDANRRFDFELKGGSFDQDMFAVVNMSGVESISRPFQFTLTLVSDKADIDFDTALESTATFRIFSPDGASSTPYYGVLSEFEQLHHAGGYTFYRAVLVPRFSTLSQYQISEVYLDKTAPELIKNILNNCHLSDVELKLTGTYRERSYVCQYQESHLDFLSRWMEKEGMYFYFDHDNGNDKLIIIDAKIAQPAKAVQVNYRPVDELDTGHADNSVQGFICRQKSLSNKVVLQDYNYRKANVTLRVEEIISEKGTGDVMLYGENFRDSDEGKRYAKIRAEEIRCGSKVFYGEATAVGLRSGHFMKLAHHFRDDFNAGYLVTEITHEGSQAGALLDGIKHPFGNQSGPTEHDRQTMYRNTFRAIPASVQFRAERTTAKPRIAGTMNATIDAEGSGQYAELDEYGQYKVQLPFDQTDKSANKSSARVRMVSPYSGSEHGMHFPLHKNAEVVLSFINGDPDQPIIMGAVPNSENKNVVDYHNSNQSVIQTQGGNAIVLDDKEGSQLMHLTAKKDLKVDVPGNHYVDVQGATEQTVEGSSSLIVSGTAQSVIAGLNVTANLLGSVNSRFGFLHSINWGLYSWESNRAANMLSDSTASVAMEVNNKAPQIIMTNKGAHVSMINTGENMDFENTALSTLTLTNKSMILAMSNEGETNISQANKAPNLAFITTGNYIRNEIAGFSVGDEGGDLIPAAEINTTTLAAEIISKTTGNVTNTVEGMTTTSHTGNVTNNIDGTSISNVTGPISTFCSSSVMTIEETGMTMAELLTFM